MKKISFVITTAVLIATQCISCKNNDHGIEAAIAASPPRQDYGFLKAKINGKAWAASKMQPDKYVSEILQIAGSNGTTALWIQLNEPAAGKTENLIQTDLNHYVDEQYNMYMIKSGKISVTKMNDQWLEGNFSFSATDDRSKKTITVTEGVYKVPNPRRFKN